MTVNLSFDADRVGGKVTLPVFATGEFVWWDRTYPLRPGANVLPTE